VKSISVEFRSVFVITKIVLELRGINVLIVNWINSGRLFGASNYLFRSSTHAVVSCAGLLSSIWYGNTVPVQRMLCIYRLRATLWFHCVKPLQNHRNGMQSRLELNVWNKAEDERKKRERKKRGKDAG
jgi:hypothetical protein